MDFSLWPACVRHHPFEVQLRAAQAGGYNCLPIGIATYRQLVGQGMSAADIRATAEDHGIRLSHFDGFVAWVPEPYSPDLPGAARQVLSAGASECLEICEALGLTAICATGVFEPGKYSNEQLAEHWAAFARRATRVGMRAELEFIPMFSIPSLAMAWSIVEGAAVAGSAVFFDTWHFLKGEVDMPLLQSMPAGSIRTLQVADGYRERRGSDLFTDCLSHREPPGQGELELLSVLKILQAKGGVDNIGPEVFSDALDALPPLAAAAVCAEGTRSLLAQAGWADC